MYFSHLIKVKNKNKVKIPNLCCRTKKSDIELATCTDVKQKWGKLKKDADALYEVVPFKKFCHGKPKTSIYKVPEVTDEEEKLFFSWAIESCPNSELAKLT